MIETKFKFWHKKLKKMSSPCHLGIIYEHLCEQFGTIVKWDDIVKLRFVCQIEDINLYEDDICEAEYNCPVGFDTEPHILQGTIEYQEEDCLWAFNYGHGSMALCEETLLITKKLGNINENPELLK